MTVAKALVSALEANTVLAALNLLGNNFNDSDRAAILDAAAIATPGTRVTKRSIHI